MVDQQGKLQFGATLFSHHSRSGIHSDHKYKKGSQTVQGEHAPHSLIHKIKCLYIGALPNLALLKGEVAMASQDKATQSCAEKPNPQPVSSLNPKRRAADAGKSQLIAHDCPSK